MPTRTPPVIVRRELRREVGFRCPVDGCGIPYLTYHHFDPVWAIEQHHRREGMIALCRRHADAADGGAYTREQLLALKEGGAQKAEAIRGEFDWMRRELFVIVGGNYFWETPVVLQIGDRRCIWLDRDEQHYLRLNFCMPTVTDQERAYIVGNGWVVPPGVGDFICPPRGRSLEVRYANGDRFRVEFVECPDRQALAVAAPTFSYSYDLPYPLTAVKIWEKASGSPVEFGPNETTLPGASFRDNFMSHSGVGYRIDPQPDINLPPPDDEDG